MLSLTAFEARPLYPDLSLTGYRALALSLALTISILTCTLCCSLEWSRAVSSILCDAWPPASLEVCSSPALGSLSPALASSFCQLCVGLTSDCVTVCVTSSEGCSLRYVCEGRGTLVN